MNASFRAWRFRRARLAPAHGSDHSIAKLAWVFAGYATAVVTVSAVAYFADGSRETVYPWITVVGSIPVAAVVWFLARHYFGDVFHRSDYIGIGVVRIGRRAIFSSAVIGAVLAILAAGLSLQFPMERQTNDSLLALMLSNGAALKAAWLMSAILVAPLVEEILFRGVLLSVLLRRWNFLVSSAASTAAFVVIHLPQLEGYIVAIVCIALLGFSTAVARRISGSLWAAIIVHASYNLVLAVNGFLQG